MTWSDNKKPGVDEKGVLKGVPLTMYKPNPPIVVVAKLLASSCQVLGKGFHQGELEEVGVRVPINYRILAGTTLRLV